LSRKSRPDEPARRVLSESVAEQIEGRILDGTFRPGDRLPPERELAEQLNVNRSSVREALKRLEELRLIEIHQGSGIRVRSLEEANLELVRRLLFQDGRPNLARIRDLLELREILFLGLVRLAIERASDDETQGLVELLERAAAPEVSEADFTPLVVEIQDAAARMTHNQVVMLLWNTLRRFLLAERFEIARRRLATERKELVPALRRFAHAVQARDVDTAQRAVKDLLRRLESAALAAFEEALASPPQGSAAPSS
jgi:GntR family transcriptional repressor for pyruvate dehydrogenase complex